MRDRRPNADHEDRERMHVTADDVGTAASASVNGEAPEEVPPSRGLTAAGGAAGGGAAGLTAGLVIGGPIGAMIGVVAGAIGGAWIGLASGERAMEVYTQHHDEEYRRHFEADEHRVADRRFEDTRAAYQLGHFAAANPDYAGRSFEDIEPHLRQGWTPEVESIHGSWEHARRYARAAFQTRRGQPLGSSFVDMEMGGTGTHRRPSFSDPIPPGDPDHVAGEGPIPGREG